MKPIRNEIIYKEIPLEETFYVDIIEENIIEKTVEKIVDLNKSKIQCTQEIINH